MEIKRFYLLLAILSICSLILIVAGSTFIDVLKPHLTFGMVTTFTFMFFCMFAFILGKRAVLSENNYRFIQVTLMIIMTKMLMGVVLVVGYVKLAEPPNKMFVVSFLFNYLLFTAYEVYFLEKVAKEKPVHSKK